MTTATDYRSMTYAALNEAIRDDEFQSGYLSNHWAAGPTGAPRRELERRFAAFGREEVERQTFAEFDSAIVADMSDRELVTAVVANPGADVFRAELDTRTAVKFDVPGHVTLKQVNRKPAGETPAQRLHRLAQKAVIEGCQVLMLDGDRGRFAVTSGNVDGIAYVVDPHAGTCTCPAPDTCKHIAITLAELGELPETPAEPVALDDYRAADDVAEAA